MPTKYDEHQVMECLSVLALHQGREIAAAKHLRRTGYDTLNANTLKKWREIQYPDRYLRAKERLEERLLSQTDLVADAALEAARDTLMEFRSRDLSEMPAEKLPMAAQGLAKVADVAITKGNEIRGKPTAIIEHRASDEKEILKKLADLGVIVEGTATEIPQLPPAANGPLPHQTTQKETAHAQQAQAQEQAQRPSAAAATETPDRA